MAQLQGQRLHVAAGAVRGDRGDKHTHRGPKAANPAQLQPGCTGTSPSPASSALPGEEMNPGISDPRPASPAVPRGFRKAGKATRKSRGVK